MSRRPRAERVRGSYIGGHEAAAITGLSPYAGPADAYARLALGAVVEQNGAMERGAMLEPAVARWVAERRGIDAGIAARAEVEVVEGAVDDELPTSWDRDAFHLDDDVPCFGGSLDVVEHSRVLHEIKTTHARSFASRWGPPGTDQVPQDVWAQTQWYLGLVSSLTEARVWCWVVDDDEPPLEYVVARDDASIASMRETCEAFWWDHVDARVPPSLARASDAAASAIYPRASEDVLDVDGAHELAVVAAQYAAAREVVTLAEETKKQLGARLKSILGARAGARWPGGSVSWKERALAARVEWEQVAHHVAMTCGLDGRAFVAAQEKYTFAPASTRSLRVTMKKETSK